MSSVRRIGSIACVGAFLLGLCDCKSGRKVEDKSSAAGTAGTTTVTSTALRDSVEDASRRVATARCEQEVSCSGLTRWTREANVTDCLGRIKVEIAKELSPEACPRGIHHNALIDCVAAIERTSCDDPVGRLMQLEDCRKSKLCVGPDAP